MSLLLAGALELDGAFQPNACHDAVQGFFEAGVQWHSVIESTALGAGSPYLKHSKAHHWDVVRSLLPLVSIFFSCVSLVDAGLELQ